MSMIQPTIGRKVWYWAPSTTSVEDTAQPFDATVIFVRADGRVDLQYTNHWGTTSSAKDVELRAPQLETLAEGAASTIHGVADRHGVGGPYATWMPFQMGQARSEKAAA